MEIPYTVKARPDTGLWNAKIGIWLFLASEVMLFGGLFSSYIFLRVGADYPWPVGVQKVALFVPAVEFEVPGPAEADPTTEVVEDIGGHDDAVGSALGAQRIGLPVAGVMNVLQSC